MGAKSDVEEKLRELLGMIRSDKAPIDAWTSVEIKELYVGKLYKSLSFIDLKIDRNLFSLFIGIILISPELEDDWAYDAIHASISSTLSKNR